MPGTTSGCSPRVNFRSASSRAARRPRPCSISVNPSQRQILLSSAAGPETVTDTTIRGRSSDSPWGTRRGTPDVSEGRSVVSVNACGSVHYVLPIRVWPSLFSADPATREAITWSRATATSREIRGGARSGRGTPPIMPRRALRGSPGERKRPGVARALLDPHAAGRVPQCLSHSGQPIGASVDVIAPSKAWGRRMRCKKHSETFRRSPAGGKPAQ